VLADKAHPSKAIRAELRRRITSVIPEPAEQSKDTASAAGRVADERSVTTATSTKAAT